jgi:hypothetical protein
LVNSVADRRKEEDRRVERTRRSLSSDFQSEPVAHDSVSHRCAMDIARGVGTLEFGNLYRS